MSGEWQMMVEDRADYCDDDGMDDTGDASGALLGLAYHGSLRWLISLQGGLGR